MKVIRTSDRVWNDKGTIGEWKRVKCDGKIKRNKENMRIEPKMVGKSDVGSRRSKFEGRTSEVEGRKVGRSKY